MGLDIDHGIWSASYETFSEFRRAIIKAANMPTPEYDKYKWYHFRGMWKEMPKDPLTVLLVHSDCDGYLFPEHMAPLIIRLKEIRDSIDEEWVENVDDWINGLEIAFENREVLRFH